jgi:serine/threonine protein kinase
VSAPTPASITGTAEIASVDAEIGTVIDERYRLVERIGVGGMGAVYRAEHVGMGRVVAVKLLRPELGGKSEAIERFTREAQASARVAHKNVVAVSDFGVRDDGALYLVMEYLRGETLRERLDRVGRMSWQHAVTIARHVARGLAHAHAQGVIHRDVKPENVFLVEDDDDSDFAKILDFGIARSLENDDARVTQAGFVVGTPAYLSPEQALGGTVDLRCDIYSLCIVLYEMICGRTPFGDRPPVAMLTAHAVVDVPPFAEVAPDVEVPPEVEAVVRRGLAKERGERHPDAGALTAALDAVRGRVSTEQPARMSTGMPVARPPTGTETPLPAPAPAALMGLPSPTVEHEGIRSWVLSSFPRLREHAFVVRWAKVVGGGLLLVGVLVAIITATPPDGGGKPATGAPSGPATTPAPAALPDLIPGPPTGATLDEKFKAAVLDLEKGKTCEERRAAVARLRELRDPRAIPVLKKARYRMRGGVVGIGDSNTNKCLKADAEAAMTALGAPPP